MLALVFAVCGFIAHAQQQDAPSVSLTLCDGTTVKGELLTKAFEGSTVFADALSLGPSLVRRIDFSPATPKVELVNGDQFAMNVSNVEISVRSLLGELKVPRGSIRQLKISGVSVTGEKGSLVFYCTFDGEQSVASPEVGPAGVLYGESETLRGRARFRPGRKGNALYVTPRRPIAKFDLPAGTIGKTGCVEFWGRIEDGAALMTDGGCPRFFEIFSFSPRGEVSQDWNSNNGCGGAGLTFRIDGHSVLASSHVGAPGYDFIRHDLYGWHHYAFAWDAEGGFEVNGAKASAAVFVDGRCVMSKYDPAWKGSVLTDVPSAIYFPTREDEVGWYSKVPFYIDEFKVWSSAKTDFSLTDE